MALTYDILVGSKQTAGSIANWASRSDLPTESILAEAQSWIYDRLRAREMIAHAALTITAGAEEIPAPDDFLQSMSLQLHADSRPLDMMDVVGFEERRYRDSDGALPSGRPTVYAAVPGDTGGGTYYFDVSADQTYTGQQWYCRRPEDLSGSNQSNFLTVRYPTLLRRACMIFAYEHQMDDQRMAQTEATCLRMIQEANVTADMALNGAIYDSEVR